MQVDSGFVRIYCQRCSSSKRVKVMHGWALLCSTCRNEDVSEWLDDDPDFATLQAVLAKPCQKQVSHVY